MDKVLRQIIKSFHKADMDPLTNQQCSGKALPDSLPLYIYSFYSLSHREFQLWAWPPLVSRNNPWNLKVSKLKL